MSTLYLAIITGCALCALLTALHMHLQHKSDMRELFEGNLRKDFIETKNSLKFVNRKTADDIIDEFEKRWKGRVDTSFLNHFIWELYTEQANHFQY